MTHLPIIDRAINHADGIAIRSDAGSYTYGELVDGSEAIAQTLLNGNSDLDQAPVAFLVPPVFAAPGPWSLETAANPGPDFSRALAWLHHWSKQYAA